MKLCFAKAWVEQKVCWKSDLGSTKRFCVFAWWRSAEKLPSITTADPGDVLPGQGFGKFQESASGNMEAGIAEQQGQQGTGSESYALNPWGDYLQRQQFVQQTLNQVGGPRIQEVVTSSPNPHQGVGIRAW